jgi:lauroyl/myristoyl acyltransferase
MLRYRLMLLLSQIARRAPAPVIYWIAWCAGTLGYYLNAPARAVAEANIRHVIGAEATDADVRRAVKGCFRAAAYYYADLGRTPNMDPERFFRENLRIEGFEHIERASAAGKGLVIATIHYGNPEYVAQSMSARGYSFFALTEPLEPQALADLYQELRSSQGQTFMPVSRSAMKAAIRHVRAGGVLCIVCDRDIQHAGVEVPFFGAPARVPSGAVDLARHTGAALIPAVARRVGRDRFRLYVEPPMTLCNTGRHEEDTRANVARLIQHFEPYLRRDPSQWFVLEEPIWGKDP